MAVLKCTSCDLPLHEIPRSTENKEYTPCCPQCGFQIAKRGLSTSGELAIVFAALVLFFPAQLLPLLSINLLGVNVFTTVTSGGVSLLKSSPFVGGLVIFCVAIMPLIFLLSVLSANIALLFHHAKSLNISTRIIHITKHWVMIDVFLISLAVACFKVSEIAKITIGPALFSFILLQILFALLLSRVSPRHYWAKFSQKDPLITATKENLNQIGTMKNCLHCGLIQSCDNQYCTRCNSKVQWRQSQSLQKTWATLITAIIFIFPANFYAISILITNGRQFQDTIFSGVATLIKQGMYGIAFIIFSASIIVPVFKIISLLYILLCIHLKVQSGKKERVYLFRFVQWIGKWSMMDLCVISIMVSLIDRNNILDFTPGPGAIAFGLVVIFTMISAESLDSRLIWDKQ